MFPGLPPTAMMSTVSGVQSSGAGFSRPGATPGDRRPFTGSQSSTETTYLYIPNSAVGAIIGKYLRNENKIIIKSNSGTKGSHIRNIIKFSGSSVKIASNDEEEAAGGGGNQGAAESGAAAAAAAVTAGPPGQLQDPAQAQRRVTILGAPEAQWKAQYLIFQKLSEEGFANGQEDIRLTVEIMVPSTQVI